MMNEYDYRVLWSTMHRTAQEVLQKQTREIATLLYYNNLTSSQAGLLARGKRLQLSIDFPEVPGKLLDKLILEKLEELKKCIDL